VSRARLWRSSRTVEHRGVGGRNENEQDGEEDGLLARRGDAGERGDHGPTRGQAAGQGGLEGRVAVGQVGAKPCATAHGHGCTSADEETLEVAHALLLTRTAHVEEETVSLERAAVLLAGVNGTSFGQGPNLIEALVDELETGRPILVGPRALVEGHVLTAEAASTIEPCLAVLLLELVNTPVDLFGDDRPDPLRQLLDGHLDHAELAGDLGEFGLDLGAGRVEGLLLEQLSAPLRVRDVPAAPVDRRLAAGRAVGRLALAADALERVDAPFELQELAGGGGVEGRVGLERDPTGGDGRRGGRNRLRERVGGRQDDDDQSQTLYGEPLHDSLLLLSGKRSINSLLPTPWPRALSLRRPAVLIKSFYL